MFYTRLSFYHCAGKRTCEQNLFWGTYYCCSKRRVGHQLDWWSIRWLWRNNFCVFGEPQTFWLFCAWNALRVYPHSRNHVLRLSLRFQNFSSRPFEETDVFFFFFLYYDSMLYFVISPSLCSHLLWQSHVLFEIYYLTLWCVFFY